MQLHLVREIRLLIMVAKDSSDLLVREQIVHFQVILFKQLECFCIIAGDYDQTFWLVKRKRINKLLNFY